MPAEHLREDLHLINLINYYKLETSRLSLADVLSKATQAQKAVFSIPSNKFLDDFSILQASKLINGNFNAKAIWKRCQSEVTYYLPININEGPKEGSLHALYIYINVKNPKLKKQRIALLSSHVAQLQEDRTDEIPKDLGKILNILSSVDTISEAIEDETY